MINPDLALATISLSMNKYLPEQEQALPRSQSRVRNSDWPRSP